jgi:antitoxin VapB
MVEELTTKITKVRKLLEENDLDLLAVQNVNNFAWLTCGASSYVDVTSSTGVAALIITPESHILVTNNIEAPRFIEEENLAAQGWDIKVTDWYQPEQVVASLLDGKRVGSDNGSFGVNLSGELIQLRMQLLPEEQERLRMVGKQSAQAMGAAISRVHPGQTEFEIAATLGEECQKRGLLPTVNMIATDDRIYSYRHPLPTSKKLEKYGMLVLCGRKYGLVASITRLVYFGTLTDELVEKMNALAFIDASMIHATTPGRKLSEVFAAAQAAYAQVGFSNEWKLHHQGGIAGYLPREVIADPHSDTVIREGQVYAWNPSITGLKSEDTILVNAQGYENLTEIHDWPKIDVAIDDTYISRPAVLEIT